MENIKFKKGDTVQIVSNTGNYHFAPLGSFGTVIDGGEYAGKICIAVKDWHEGHSCGGILAMRDGQFIKPCDLKIVGETKLIFYKSDRKVTAKLLVGKKCVAEASATCSPSDIFNILIGAQIALLRLCEKQGVKPVISAEILKNIDITVKSGVEVI